MDPITEVFQSIQIASVIQARLEASAPWGLKRDAKVGVRKHSAAISPSPYAHFGMLTLGNCWLIADDLPDAIPLSSGDCFLLAPGRLYTLGDHPETGAQSFCSVASENGSQVIECGGGGAPTTILYGWFRFCESGQKRFERLLPPLTLLRANQPEALVLRRTMDMLASEMTKPGPGSDLIVQHLADILCVQCVRAHIDSQSGTPNEGLLRAFFDPQIGAALKSMHEKVAAPWTVETLAAACGMSRSAFASRFKELVGETPLEYLTSWRMHKATTWLRKSDRKLIDIAKSVGYDSHAAFSKAFKRVVHVAPRDVRLSKTSSNL